MNLIYMFNTKDSPSFLDFMSTLHELIKNLKYTIWLVWTQFTLILVCTRQNNISLLIIHYIMRKTYYIIQTHSLYHTDTHYIIQKLTILFRNTLYHAETHYIIQTHTISSGNSLYHSDTHYIMEKLNHSIC